MTGLKKMQHDHVRCCHSVLGVWYCLIATDAVLWSSTSCPPTDKCGDDIYKRPRLQSVVQEWWLEKIDQHFLCLIIYLTVVNTTCCRPYLDGFLFCCKRLIYWHTPNWESLLYHWNMSQQKPWLSCKQQGQELILVGKTWLLSGLGSKPCGE